MTVYLDNCALSRLTDDQTQERIREEAEAVERVFAGVRRGSIDLVSSEALEDEIRRNPSMERCAEAAVFLSLALLRVEVNDAIADRAGILSRCGYGPYDALHLACAEAASADVLLTSPGDYARDRQEWQKTITLDDILKSVRERRQQHR